MRPTQSEKHARLEVEGFESKRLPRQPQSGQRLDEPASAAPRDKLDQTTQATLSRAPQRIELRGMEVLNDGAAQAARKTRWPAQLAREARHPKMMPRAGRLA